MQKTICVDFDGVLHSYTTPWKNAWTIPDPPVKGAMRWLVDICMIPDFKVVIYSGRSHSQIGVDSMRKWIKKHITEAAMGEYAHNKALELLFFSSIKPAAWLTIDDRCICFSGTFPTTRAINNFKPWYDKYAEVADK